MDAEILPCPVCGKPCRWAAALVGVKFFILCAVDCPYGGTSGDTESAAIEAHNAIARAAARVAELEQAFDDIEGHRQNAASRVRKLEAERDRMRVALECQADLEALRDAPVLSDDWHAIIRRWRDRILDSPEAMNLFIGCQLHPGWESEGLRRLAPILRRAALTTAGEEQPR